MISAKYWTCKDQESKFSQYTEQSKDNKFFNSFDRQQIFFKVYLSTNKSWQHKYSGQNTTITRKFETCLLQ